MLIAGAAGRLGGAISSELLAYGDKVIFMDREFDDHSKSLFERYQRNAILFEGDCGNKLDVRKAIKLAIKKFDRVDAAIHCAYPRSPGWGTKFEDLKTAYLQQDLNDQLGGTIIFSQSILAYFATIRKGHLILTSSIMGIAAPKFEHYVGSSINSPLEYSVIKSGIISMTKYLAKYYKNQNIRVNCVSPGGILAGQDEIFIEKYRMSCCSKGMLDPEDIVGTFQFLLSHTSLHINGQNIIIDDGWSL